MYDNILLSYLKDVRKHPLLTKEQEKDLALRIKKGDKNAHSRLVESNLRLVIKLAKQYRGVGDGLMDLIQEGNLGLMIAADKFSSSYNVRFASYACWWIHQAINRFLNGKERPIRLPVRKEELLKRIKAFKILFKEKHGRYPKFEEISASLKIAIDDIVKIQFFLDSMLSLDAPLKEGDGTCLYDTAPDENTNPEELVIDEFSRNSLYSIFEEILTFREKDVIARRFCLLGEKKAEPLSKIGKRYGISAESVRQSERRALRKLREKKSEIAEFYSA